ncbi:MAG TPA: response regulator [Deltaproteobacteria bacterium]|nr:response regulator [Deltaproteobacteria bacterium]
MERKPRVLIVDDEQDFANTLAERLTLRNFDTEVKRDGKGALVAVEQNPPDVVVLDIKMPGIGGFEVLKRIKSEHPRLPVILLTGHGCTNNGIKGMELGAFDYLIKPVEIKELMTKIKAAIESSRFSPKEQGKS